MRDDPEKTAWSRDELEAELESRENIIRDMQLEKSHLWADKQFLEAQCAALREALIGASIFYSGEGKICFQPAHCLQSEERHEDCLAAEQALSTDAGSALLRRLQAAETVCELAEMSFDQSCFLEEALEAWHKAKEALKQ